MPEAQPWSFFGKHNGFRFCIPEITEAELIANYSATYSYGDLDWAANLYYNVHEVSFDSPAVWNVTVFGDSFTLTSPMTYGEPKDSLCGGDPILDETKSFVGTPPDFTDYYEYSVQGNFDPGALYRIVYAQEPEDGPRYIYLSTLLDGSSCFAVYENSAFVIGDRSSWISMHNTGSSNYQVVIDGKTFWGYQFSAFGGSLPPRITGVTFYTY